jgi:hypothetical protein
MLSPAQIELYGPAWGRVCEANQWRQARGRLVPEARGPGFSRFHALVWARSDQHALAEHKGVGVENLRRGCNAVITGRFCSTWDLTNFQFTRLLNLFDLLIDPDNLAAVIRWEHPENDERAWKIALLRRLRHDAQIAHVSQDLFQTMNWEELPLPQLEALRRKFWTQDNRPDHRARRRTAAAAPQPVGAGAADPDWTV